MSKQKTILFLAGVGLLFGACGSEHNILSNQTPAVGARLKLLHAVVDAPAVNVFANNTKLNGAALAYGAAFPSEYSAIAPGATTLRVSTAASGTVVEATVLTLPITLENDKFYTIVATGTATAPVAFLVNDDQTVPDPTKNYIRVLNLVANGTPVDLAIGGALTTITNIPYRGVSDYVAVDPNTAAAAYALQIRNTGLTTLVGTALNFNTLNRGRKITLVVRGSVGRIGAQAPTLGTYTVK